MSPLYHMNLTMLDGSLMKGEELRGHPVLIVNTASQCGFTKQYHGLQKIWETHQEKGLIILGVPSNDFGKQQPQEGAALKQDCELRFGVSFPLLKRSPVKGKNALPLFQFLAKEGGFLSLPRWNFYKYLITKEGQLSSWHIPLTAPNAPHFQRALNKVL